MSEKLGKLERLTNEGRSIKLVRHALSALLLTSAGLGAGCDTAKEEAKKACRMDPQFQAGLEKVSKQFSINGESSDPKRKDDIDYHVLQSIHQAEVQEFFKDNLRADIGPAALHKGANPFEAIALDAPCATKKWLKESRVLELAAELESCQEKEPPCVSKTVNKMKSDKDTSKPVPGFEPGLVD